MSNVPNSSVTNLTLQLHDTSNLSSIWLSIHHIRLLVLQFDAQFNLLNLTVKFSVIAVRVFAWDWWQLDEKAPEEEFDSVEDMKQHLRKVWVEIDADVCDEMMQSIPKRLGAVIRNKGKQITHYDH